MTPEACRSSYRRVLAKVGEHVVIRRYTGSGPNRPRFDWTVRARVVEFDPSELIGGIVQGDRKIIVLAQDLMDAQAPVPVVAGANWKAVVRGKEVTIKAVDDNTRRVAGELIAYELTVGG